VDGAVVELGDRGIRAVIAVGGGSVIDAGKAISAMLVERAPVTDFLEGIGERTPSGGRVGLIAVPTTSGTGSEATKNAVLSRVGENGFKKSLRHDSYMPDIAIVDPMLMRSCPPGLTASVGLDAFSQLLESYLSTKSSEMTDSLALGGMRAVFEHLVPAYRDGHKDIDARSGMAYAALMSGICLANAGLGVVHGIAGPLGGLFPIPHGVACGTILGACVRKTIKKLRESEDTSDISLRKLSIAGQMSTVRRGKNDSYYVEALADTIDRWLEQLEIPRLGAFGISAGDIESIVSQCDNKTSPVKLSRNDMIEILTSRL
jgi:alcohol dehydrogenase class IV